MVWFRSDLVGVLACDGVEVNTLATAEDTLSIGVLERSAKLWWKVLTIVNVSSASA